ncbi:hypothetical protein [Streptomyces sp. SID3212]|uniref:hypothetical protein n=1 Tax=Streptomyces sp. SID3212 TaxID=2690259 RepID=UPI00136A1FAF|nr:hypothetical protein [Streptomyces sp. SID3212]MYV55037.1 hypothetical protein [Streptomyces sp. SID3212]
MLSNVGAIQEVWEAVVRADGGTAHDLVAALDTELAALRRALDGHPSDWAYASATTDSSTSGTQNGPRGPALHRDPDAVNTALNEADQHHHVLRDVPEWQDIQTVRGAARNLWQAIKRETGARFERLLGDGRFQGWWKGTSIRVCERISGLALWTADRLRGDDLEPTEAMDRLHRAAGHYSRPAPAPSAEVRPEVRSQMRKLGEGLAAAQVKVNAARARSSTVRKPPAPPPRHYRTTGAPAPDSPRSEARATPRTLT